MRKNLKQVKVFLFFGGAAAFPPRVGETNNGLLLYFPIH